MEINLNMNAGSPYGLFNVGATRADDILDHISIICERACEDYETQYRVVEIVKQAHGGDETMQRLDTAKMLKQMVEFAANEDEKNYILYLAYTGINRVNQVIFAELYEEPE